MIGARLRLLPTTNKGSPTVRSRIACWLIALLFIQIFAQAAARADDWPQWLGPRRDGIWRETGILDKFPKGGPKVLWRTKIGPGYTGPAVVGDRVYVMDRQAPPLAKGSESPGKGGLTGKERVLCLSAADGKLIWQHAYDCTYKIYYPSGPRTTPVVDAGKVYTLGAMGDIYCLDAASGKVHWSKSLLKDYKTKAPLWGYAAHPLIDGNRLICLVGGENSAVAAFDKHTGKELWHALTVEEIGYAPPLVVEAGGKRQLIVFHTEAVAALDLATGKPYWSEPFPGREPARPAITVSTPLHVGDRLYVTSPHHGSLMLKLAADKPAATVVWKSKETSSIGKTDGLHAIMCTPALKDGHVYGVCIGGELRCLKADTGERLWQTYAATGGRKALFATVFMVQQRDRFFIFNDAGDLIIARLTPKGYEEIDRAHLLEPTLFSRGRDVVWTHPAFANRCVYVRNDQEIICVSLAEEGGKEKSVIAPNAKLEKLSGGFAFTEGPAADAAGNVYFTDQPNNRILKWSVDGKLSTFLEPCGRSNGLCFDAKGNLWACADEKNELWRIDPDKKVTVVVKDYQGKLLNGPNDVWVRPDQGVYFTDPFYKRSYWKRGPMEQGGQHVYYLPPDGQKLVRVTDDLKQPNGIIGTPDGKTLYVADIAASRTYAYDIQADGTLANKRLFCKLGSDGMTLDDEGNVYLTGKGVIVFDKSGKQIERIAVPESWTANVCFGGRDRQTLFVTASRGLYGLRMRVKGAGSQ